MTETAMDVSNASLVKEKKKKKKKKSIDADDSAVAADVSSSNGAAAKKEEEEVKTEPVDKYDELLRFLSPISKPLASKKLTKKLYKLVRKSSKEKGVVRRGIRESMKFIRKGETGLVVLAGDVSPIDVASHVPFVCEEKKIPYCYTPSKQELGEALGSKRPTCMTLIKCGEDGTVKELYDDCFGKVKELPLPI